MKLDAISRSLIMIVGCRGISIGSRASRVQRAVAAAPGKILLL